MQRAANPLPGSLEAQPPTPFFPVIPDFCTTGMNDGSFAQFVQEILARASCTRPGMSKMISATGTPAFCNASTLP